MINIVVLHLAGFVDILFIVLIPFIAYNRLAAFRPLLKVSRAAGYHKITAFTVKINDATQ